MGRAALQLDFDLDAAASVTGPSPHCERQASGGSRAGCAHTGTFNGPVTAAAAKRERGIQRVLENAGDEFRAAAYTFICKWARLHSEIVPEDVSNAYMKSDLPKPHDKRAFAGLWRKAVKDLVVERIDAEGWSRSRCSPTYRYRSLVIA